MNFDPSRVGFARVRAQMLDDLQQRLGRIDRHLADKRRLIGALGRNDEAAQRRFLGAAPLARGIGAGERDGVRHRQRAAHRPQLA